MKNKNLINYDSKAKSDWSYSTLVLLYIQYSNISRWGKKKRWTSGNERLKLEIVHHHNDATNLLPKKALERWCNAQ